MADGSKISSMPTTAGLDGTELVPLVTVGAITAITKAINAVVTISNASELNPFSAGQKVTFANVGGMTALNNQTVAISATGGTQGAWTLTLPVDSTGYGTYTSGGVAESNAKTQLKFTRINVDGSPYNPTFQSGGVVYNGPDGQLTSDNNVIFGKAIPNPSGIIGPCLLLGSGGGGGSNVSYWIIMDQAFDTATPGNDMGITSGEVQPGSSQRGGKLFIIAGGADLGPGGDLTLQGGTSANGVPGITALQGANNTSETHPAGDVFVIAGQVGSQGANVHLIATKLHGLAGVIRHRSNSDIILDEFADGSWFFYLVGGGTYGDVGAPIISRGAGAPLGPAQPSEVTDHVEVINGKTFTWVKGLLKSVV
jgi:hypothetical protein